MKLAKESKKEIQSQLEYVDKKHKKKIEYEKKKKKKKKIKDAISAKEQKEYDEKYNRRTKRFGVLYWIPLYLYIPIVGFWSSTAPEWWAFFPYSLIYIMFSYSYHLIFLDLFMGELLGFDLTEVADTKLKIKKEKEKVNTLIDELDYVMKMGAKRPFNKRNYQKIDTLLDKYFKDPAPFSSDAKIELRKIVYKAIKDLPKTYADDKVMLKKKERKLRKL